MLIAGRHSLHAFRHSVIPPGAVQRGHRHQMLRRKPEITKVDRDQQQVANWFQIWSAHVRKALVWIAETPHLHNVWTY